MNLCKNFTLALTLGLGLVAHAQAGNVSLTAGQWSEFHVDDFSSVSQGTEWIDLDNSNSSTFGTPTAFQFTIANGYKGVLTVVDAGFAGDNFQVFNQGQSLGFTSLTSNSTDYSNDFDINLLNPNFSKGLFALEAGAYSITGSLAGTLQAFNATNGAVKLEVSTVPLPSSLSLFLAGLSVAAIARRRRAKFF